jgi:phosphoribosylanthranilate isomerase
MTQVKICGITNLRDALTASMSGADMIGFNFYAKSPRFITPSDVRAISGDLPARVKKVGVFVNERIVRIFEVAQIAGLDAIQLHGDESAEFVDEVRAGTGLAVIKAIRVSSGSFDSCLLSANGDPILLDTFSDIDFGGTGKTCDWKTAARISSIRRVLLAGGLGFDNVSEAIKVVKPFAVDACSRLEISPGKKDSKLVKTFIANAKNAV